MNAPLHIVLATYEGARFLPELLDSVIAQSDPDWVLLASDDGSGDDTPAILARYGERDPRIRVLPPLSARLGIRGNFERLLGAALNAADSAGFLLCDQDDRWRHDKLGRMRAALECAKGGVPLLAYADLALIDGAGRRLAASHFVRAGVPRVRGGVGRWLLAHNVIPGCAMAGNRALLELALPFPPRVVHHDWWLALVAAAAGEVVAVDATLTEYRQHAANAIGAQAPAHRALAFLRGFSRGLQAARAQYRVALDQAEALVDRVGARGHPGWIADARNACTQLGSPRWRPRLAAIVAGPVRRLGFARNVLMLLASRPSPAGSAAAGRDKSAVSG